jgi:hypothetical protein
MLPIENKNRNGKIEARIWFFGTGRENCMGMGGSDCVMLDQIAWFKETSDKIDPTDPARKNGIAFMHTPL